MTESLVINNEALRAKFSPDGSVLRRHQLRMLDILIEIDRICKKHDIAYWLSSGTLIGAMRHNGFIPWDDDIDIEMMRKDYLRLMKILPAELPDWLAIQTDETDPDFFYFYAKIRDRHSRLTETVDYGKNWKEQGIYIDIFPMERHPIWLHKLTELSIGHTYKIWRTSHDKKKSIKKIRCIFLFNKHIIYPALRLLCRLIKDKTITSGMGIPFHNPRYADEIFPLTTHEFEGIQFPVPGNTDAHLRHIYGDYMRLPDLDKLAPHVKDLDFYDDSTISPIAQD